MMERRGRYSRGYLPHLDAEGSQFLTWRLKDSLPKTVLDDLKAELPELPPPEQTRELNRRVEAFCDAGHGSCVLRETGCSMVVQQTLLRDHGRRYELHAWVIMPNHVHVLLTPAKDAKLAQIVRSLKASSALRVNRLLNKEGQLWQEDYFDRLIRSERHFAGVVKYIEWNPVKAKLCQDPSLWPYSSASPSAKAALTNR